MVIRAHDANRKWSEESKIIFGGRDKFESGGQGLSDIVQSGMFAIVDTVAPPLITLLHACTHEYMRVEDTFMT